MGLSASQARFLQLTARRSNIEYETQQINFQRLQLSNQLADASKKYQDEISNRKMMFTYNDGSGTQKVELSYTNYKNYMNQQLEGLNTAHEKFYLVSSSGNKVVVGSQEEMQKMIEMGKGTPISKKTIDEAKARYEAAIAAGENPSDSDKRYANMDLSDYTLEVTKDEDGNTYENYVKYQFSEKDFLIASDLDDVTNFQMAIENGTYFFARFKQNSETGKQELRTEGWETLGGGAIIEELDKSDDAEAEAKYQTLQDRIQAQDKKLELQIDQLETDRNAIQTEIDSVKNVIKDNVEKTFNSLS